MLNQVVLFCCDCSSRHLSPPETVGIFFGFFVPVRSKSICQHPGCSVLIDAPGKCQKHRAVENKQRGSSAERGYGARWQAARVHYLRAHPLCVYCQRAGRVTPAEVVDHIVPHKLKQALDSGIAHLIAAAKRLFWDSSNWQALCKRCHDTTKQAEEAADGYR